MLLLGRRSKHKSKDYILGVIFIMFVQTERFEWTKRTNEEKKKLLKLSESSADSVQC